MWSAHTGLDQVGPLGVFAILGAFLIVIHLGFASATALTSALLLEIRHDTGMSFQSSAWLTSLPVICMGLVALLIRCFALCLAVAALPLALLTKVPLEVLFVAGFLCSLVQFCLYPLAVAFSNDHVEGDRRVSLTAMLLVTYGIGASVGPLLAGVVMKLFGSHMLYAFFSLCALILVWRIRPKAVTNLHQVDDAPLP